MASDVVTLLWLRAQRRAIGLLAVAFVAALLILQIWHALLPSFGPAEYRYDDGVSHSGFLPLDVESDGHELQIHTTMRLAALHPLLFSVTPDDCLQALAVNGRPLRFDRPLCLERGGTVWLGSVLREGDNTIDMTVTDQGGRGGASFGVSMTDPVFLGACALASVLAGVCAWISIGLVGHRGLAASLLAVVVVGLALRIPHLLSPGYLFDVRLNAHWAKSAALLGLGRSYVEQVNEPRLPNYPPLQLAVFDLTGRAYRWLSSPTYDVGLRDCTAFMKLPAVAADIVTALLVLFVTRRLDPRRWVATAAALLYAAQPAVWYDSSVWGQVDSIFALTALCALVAAVARRWALMGALITLSLLTKLQAIVALPAIGLVCALERGAFKRAGAAALLTCAPFLLILRTGSALQAVKDVYTHSAGFFPVLSMYAYNAWVALFGLAATDLPDSSPLFGLTSCRNVGAAVFVACTLALVAWGWRRLRAGASERTRAAAIFGIPALTTYAFFLFNTEMHERYLFLVVPFGLPAVVAFRRGMLAYLAASLLLFINLLGALPWGDLDRAMFRELPNVPAVIGTCNVVLFMAVLTALGRRRRRAP